MVVGVIEEAQEVGAVVATVEAVVEAVVVVLVVGVLVEGVAEVEFQPFRQFHLDFLYLLATLLTFSHFLHQLD